MTLLSQRLVVLVDQEDPVGCGKLEVEVGQHVHGERVVSLGRRVDRVLWSAHVRNEHSVNSQYLNGEVRL